MGQGGGLKKIKKIIDPRLPSVENNSGGKLENNSSVENNSGGTLENNSGGTLENEQLVLIPATSL